MRRFTNEKQIMPMPVADNTGYYILCAIKLAAYEDTGLSPEEVKKLARPKPQAAKERRSARREGVERLIERTFGNKVRA